MYLISVDGVSLNPNMSWAEEFQAQGVVQRVRHTLGGLPVVGVASKSSLELTLTATLESGWLTTAMVSHLRTLASIPGAIFPVTIDEVLEGVPVMFRHHEAPAVSFIPLTPKAQYAPTDYWVGTIKLMTI